MQLDIVYCMNSKLGWATMLLVSRKRNYNKEEFDIVQIFDVVVDTDFQNSNLQGQIHRIHGHIRGG